MPLSVSRRTLLKWAAAMSLPSPAAMAKTGAFPRAVEHAFGRTAIASPPQRLVTIGYGDEASFLALGCKPVAIAHSGMFSSGMTPWCEQSFGADKPGFLDGSLLDYEAVASLKPDLIAGIFSGLDSVSYGRMNRIAPTVAYRSGPWRAGWREQIRIAGDVLGMEEMALNRIADTEASLRRYGNHYPALKGKSFTFGSFFAGSSRIVVYLPGETRVDWMVEVGMRPSDGVQRLAIANPGRVSADASLEDLESVTADLLVMWYEPGARAALEKHILFQRFDPVRRGNYFVLEEPAEIWAASWPNVLAIPRTFPGFLPRMEATANAEKR